MMIISGHDDDISREMSSAALSYYWDTRGLPSQPIIGVFLFADVMCALKLSSFGQLYVVPS